MDIQPEHHRSLDKLYLEEIVVFLCGASGESAERFHMQNYKTKRLKAPPPPLNSITKLFILLIKFTPL